MTNNIWTTGIARITELEDVELTSSASLDILQRNSSGTYVNRQPIGTETSQTVNSSAANDTTPGANTARYGFFTVLPSTAPLWLITGIEWKNGTVVNGTTNAAVMEVDADPPSSLITNTYAWGSATQTGAGVVQRLGPTALTSQLVPAGKILGAYILTSSATGRYLTATVASRNNQKTITAGSDQTMGSAGAWTATTEEPYMKIYYKPVLGV